MTSTPPLRRYRFTTEAYSRMGEVGILDEDDRVELLDGEIFEMSPFGTRHSAVLSRLITWFVPAVAGRAIVRPQDPLVLSDFSAPQPDIAVVRWVENFHEDEHPRPDDVLLVVEIADSSLAMDLGRKAWLYSAAGVPEYWVVDLAHERLIVHTGPGPDGYDAIRSLSGPDVVTAAALPGAGFTVDDMLGRRRPA